MFRVFIMGLLGNFLYGFMRVMKSERGDFGSSSDKSSAETGITSSGTSAYDASKATPEELSQYKSSFSTGQLLDALMKYQMGLGAAPTGYQNAEQQYQNQGPMSKALYNAMMGDVQNPYATYESNLQPSLQAAQDYINRQAQSRGLIRSGIPIEAMGRAGVELAIQEADKRMAYRQQGMQNASSLNALSGNLAQTNLSNLSSLYGTQQTAGQQAMNRQYGAAWQNAQMQAYPYQAQLGNYYGSQGGLGSGIGAGVGAVAGGLTAMALPGSQAFLVPMGASIGSGIGKNF